MAPLVRVLHFCLGCTCKLNLVQLPYTKGQENCQLAWLALTSLANAHQTRHRKGDQIDEALQICVDQNNASAKGDSAEQFEGEALVLHQNCTGDLRRRRGLLLETLAERFTERECEECTSPYTNARNEVAPLRAKKRGWLLRTPPRLCDNLLPVATTWNSVTVACILPECRCCASPPTAQARQHVVE